MVNPIKRLQQISMKNQSKTAIVSEESLTFSGLWSKTDAFAGGLRANDITAGDHVAIRVSNPRAFLIAFYGTLRNGCVPVTIPTEFSADDVVVALNETDGTAYVTDETPFLSILHRAEAVRLAITVDCSGGMGIDFPTFLDNDGINTTGTRSGIDVVSRSDVDRGLVAYGRHTGGEPLGVVYDQSALTAAARAGKSIAVSDGPMHHLGSLSLSNPIELLSGATAALLSGGQYAGLFTGGRHHPHTSWDPDTVSSLLNAGTATRTFVTPTQYESLQLSQTADGNTVIVAEPAADSIETPVSGSTRVLGCPETGLTHIETAPDEQPVAVTGDSPIGKTVPGVETRIIDDGTTRELAVNGPATMDHYIGHPELTDELVCSIDGDRWIRTGVSLGTAGAVAPINDSPLSVLGRSHS